VGGVTSRPEPLVVRGRHGVAGHTEIVCEHAAGWHQLPRAKRTALDEARDPPHCMISAPNVTNDQLSLPTAADDAYPWLHDVAYTGPGGFLIVTLSEPAEAATQAGGRP
jgi:hypothetical protein